MQEINAISFTKQNISFSSGDNSLAVSDILSGLAGNVTLFVQGALQNSKPKV
jgi:hypothetical protein